MLGLRSFYLQVIGDNEIISRASSRFNYTVELSTHRGTILDRNEHPLAVSLDVSSIAANPRLIKNPYYEALRISKVLGVDNKLLASRLKSEKYFVWLKRHVTPEEVEQLKALNINGIGFYKESKRFYPERDAMANLLGFVGMEGSGLEGLELFYNNMLRGISRHVIAQRDGLGRTIYARGVSPETACEGYNLRLTIDRRMQYIAYAGLVDAINKHNANSGFVIITDPTTGAIYAMASYPSFDPNKGAYKNLFGHKNKAVVDTFEPGSVMKPFFVSWGLDNNLFRSSDSVFCENGKLSFHHVTIHDHEKYGWLTVSNVVKYSSNIGMVKLTSNIGPHSLYECMRTFGFGSPTGLDFSGEVRGIVRNPEKWTEVDTANVSFGQGFNVTGVQLISAFNAMVNGGLLVKPHLIDSILDAKGRVIHSYKPSIVRRVISPEASQQIVDIMKTVVESGGTGTAASMDAYKVFGKTGTAQKIDPITGTYSHGAYLTTFIGGVMDANDKPVMTVLVCIDEPYPFYYASQVACPLFKDISSKCTNVMNVVPLIKLAQKV